METITIKYILCNRFMCNNYSIYIRVSRKSPCWNNTLNLKCEKFQTFLLPDRYLCQGLQRLE